QGATASAIASVLASNINSDGGAVATASASGSTVYLTAKTQGAGTNYALSTSTSSQAGSFSSGASGGALTGGRDAVYTTYYDAGTATITVNGHGDSYAWSNGSSASSIASGLASAINGDGSASVSASAS